MEPHIQTTELTHESCSTANRLNADNMDENDAMYDNDKNVKQIYSSSISDECKCLTFICHLFNERICINISSNAEKNTDQKYDL